MSVIARKIAATPKRTADEAWKIIVSLISDQSSDTKKILDSITGIVSAIIVDEVLSDTPIVITGKGPRLRIYCIYGEDALSDDNCDEEPLVQKPTEENWHMYLPCSNEDLGWVTESLKQIINVTPYDKDKELEIEKSVQRTDSLNIDTNTFLNKP